MYPAFDFADLALALGDELFLKLELGLRDLGCSGLRLDLYALQLDRVAVLVRAGVSCTS